MADMQELITKINEYAKLAKQRELTEDEQADRQALREQYMALFKQNFKEQLDNTYVQKDDGTKVALKDWHTQTHRDAHEAFDR